MVGEPVQIKTPIKEIQTELFRGIQECSHRSLLNTKKWLSETLFSISGEKLSPDEIPTVPLDCNYEIELYYLSKSYFDNKEYDRCAYYAKGCNSPLIRFLNMYARYLSLEKKKIEDMTDVQMPPSATKNEKLKCLHSDLKQVHQDKQLDGYGLYLYGIILKKLDLHSLALDMLVEAVHANPINWSAWVEITLLVPDKAKLNSLVLPDHWMKHFFLVQMYIDMSLNDEALEICSALQAHGFDKNHYILAQTAVAHHNLREVDKAIETFKTICEKDPFRLDNLDTYSNLLYVRELKTELAHLAHHAIKIDKYRVETCCVIGNYYSLRGDHQKSVLYFQRALKLNPYYLSAWTLMGHEYMEMKNTNAAIHSYRQAIEVNRRDYRAWYGLGQTYEIIKMPAYGIYYYKQAQQLRPKDSRMLIALGDAYEKNEKIENALKCFYKACTVGDIEGIALTKMAKLYDKLGEEDSAAAAYTKFCLDENRNVSSDPSELFQAYRYLANYHTRKDKLDEANNYAFKCLEHEETKEEGKALLRTIASKRSQQENLGDCPMDETVSLNPSSPIRRTPLSPRSDIDVAFSPPI